MKKCLKYLLVLGFAFLLVSNKSLQKTTGPFVVVIDAGHGGGDSGNLGFGKKYREKDIALKVALKLGQLLEKDPQIKVIYTRKKDVFVPLIGRAKIANKADADLFVSIHCNAHGSNAYGTETFVLGVANTKRNFEIAKKENEVIFFEENYKQTYGGFDPNSPESTIGIQLEQEVYTKQSVSLAHKIEKGFKSNLKRKSRGLKQASLWVLHNTYMPSVLVELGFLTNKNEGKYLNSSKGQQNMANSIYDAIITFKKEIDVNVGENILNTNTPKIDDIQNNDTIEFKVQIAASSRKLATKPYNFKGLKPVSREKIGTTYKYFFGQSAQYKEVKKLKKVAQEKGYKSAFIVAYKNGKKVKLTEILKTSSD